MTSSTDRRPNYARRFLWLAVAIVLAITAYTAAWHYFAGRVIEQVNAGIAALNRDGRRAACEGAEARGYPFRMGVFCNSVLYEDARAGVGLRARAFRSAAQVYRPWHIVGELDGPATVQIPGLNALEIEWASLGASLRVPTLPERFSIEGRDVRIGIDRQVPVDTPLATAQNAQIHIRWAGDDLDVAVRFGALALTPELTEGASLPPISGLVDVTVDDGTWLPNSHLGPLRGKSGTLRELTLSLDAETGATLSGPVAIDEEGLVDADLEVTLRNPQALAPVLGELMPDNRQAIELALSGLSGGGQTATLPLRIAKSQVSVGFLSLGTLPPL